MILIPAQLIKAVEEKDWLWQEFAELFNRLFTSLSQLIRNQPVYDQLALEERVLAPLFAESANDV